MDVESSLEQVAGILVREDFRFTTSNDRRSYRLLFDSAAVFIDFDEWQDGVVVTVHSPVLQGIDEDGPGAAIALNRLNELNRRHFFTKFTFSNGTLVAEYDLLGDQLQAGELVNAIMVVAAAADRLDDELRGQLGGKPYVELLEDRVAESEGEDGEAT